MRRSVSASRTIPFTVFLAVLTGCASTPPPDKEMLSAPTGLWISTKDSAITLDIQASGDLLYTANGQEQSGTWEAVSESAIRANVNGETFDMPYTRKDLTLSITLPNQTSPTEFTQM